jgi:hypothetical protein
MVRFALFEMEDQRPKRLSVRTQVRDFIVKVFNYVKRKQTTVSQCAELCCASKLSGFDVANWKWSKGTVILTKLYTYLFTYLLHTPWSIVLEGGFTHTMPFHCHAVLLRVYIVSFTFDLHSAAVFDSHIRPIHTYHAVPLPCRSAKGLYCVVPI